jgi:26S proteasome regulatory subunit N10
MSTGVQATFFLIDNSVSSLDGDFIPNRLAAQISTIDSVAGSLLHANRESTAGFGTLSGNFGVCMSLTSEYRSIRHALEKVERDGTVQFNRAVRCGILALRHARNPNSKRCLIILIGSSHGLAESDWVEIADLANQNAIEINCFALGPDPEPEPLRQLCRRNRNGRFQLVRPSRTELPEIIVEALLTRGEGPAPDSYDEQVQRALEASRREHGIDRVDDPDLQAAIAASMEDFLPRPPPPGPLAPDEAAELAEAMRLSLENEAEGSPDPVAGASGDKSTPQTKTSDGTPHTVRKG